MNGVCCRSCDNSERSLGKRRNVTPSSSSTYALAPVYCADSQQTTTTDTSALTVVPQSPNKARTLPSPHTCPRRQIIGGHSPTTMRRHKFIVDGGIIPRFNDLDVWRTTHDPVDLSVWPPHSVWNDADLLPPPPLSSTTSSWQRCGCAAGPPPCMTTPDRVRGTAVPLSSALVTTPVSFQTFKPSSATSPAEVETSCAISLRPNRCGDALQTTTRTMPSCQAMSLRAKHAPDNSIRSEQPTT